MLCQRNSFFKSLFAPTSSSHMHSLYWFPPMWQLYSFYHFKCNIFDGTIVVFICFPLTHTLSCIHTSKQCAKVQLLNLWNLKCSVTPKGGPKYSYRGHTFLKRCKEAQVNGSVVSVEFCATTTTTKIIINIHSTFECCIPCLKLDLLNWGVAYCWYYVLAVSVFMFPHH